MSAISNIKNVVTNKTARTILLGQKYSPEILTVAGLGAVLTGAVLASRATLQLEQKVTDLEDGVRAVHDHYYVEESDQRNKKRDLTKAYIKGSYGIVKLYAPSGGLVLLGTASVLGGHGLLKKRNVGLLAAYKAVDSSFAKYRERVVEEYGEDKDKQFKMGLRAVDQKGEDGKKEVAMVFDPDLDRKTDYSVMFTRENVNWNENEGYNIAFLKSIQAYMNDRLKARGHVFLNDVYDALGFADTSAGSVVGWIFNADNGDDFIDFGLYDFNNIKKGAFIDGTEGHIRLDFNVDGPIWDKI